MTEDTQLFLGGALIVLAFSVAGYWIPAYQAVAINQLGTLIGAAAMKMRGNV